MIAIVAAAVLLASARPAVANGERVAYSIAIDGPVLTGPMNELRRAIRDARAMRAALLIVRLNTPGGSATDTRQMITSMLAAPMPAVVTDNGAANRALRARLVDVVAPDERALLERLDGFSVKRRKAQRPRTAGLQIRAGELSATELADDLPGGGGSFWRSLLLVGGGALTLVLIVVGTSRGRRYRRRRQRRQRVRERERERGPTA